MLENTDYIIICATSKDGKISEVKWKIVLAGGDVKPYEYTKRREDVIDKLENGSVIRTGREENGEWKLSPEVDYFERDDVIYIKTKPNETARDNLGELPKC